MNLPEIVDIAPAAEGVFHNLVFVSIRKTYSTQAYKVHADGSIKMDAALKAKVERLFKP